ncbi:MAG: hypothetical protein MUC88_28625, partial [Planctomycetes bacterium]|nr:hypothetical protein [Planctomycetota bacterium]
MVDTVGDNPIPENELVITASRSSGPGGQNVNKLNTRVIVLFDVTGSPSLSNEQKQEVLSRLATRIDKRGVLHVASQAYRSQEANRRRVRREPGREPPASPRRGSGRALPGSSPTSHGCVPASVRR